MGNERMTHRTTGGGASASECAEDLERTARTWALLQKLSARTDQPMSVLVESLLQPFAQLRPVCERA